jgi:adenine specific DNA methylase Mod
LLRQAARENGQEYESNQVFQGYTDCGCPEKEYKRGIVLDPFCGTGTTLRVAEMLGRNWIGIDLKPAYIKIAEQRMGLDNDFTNLPLFKEI